MIEFHSRVQFFHQGERVHARLRRPVGIQLKVDIFRICLRKEQIIRRFLRLNVQKFTVMIVVQKLNARLFQNFSGGIQIPAQPLHRGFIRVIKAVHSRDDNIFCAEGFCLFCNRLRLPSDRSKIFMDARHTKSRFFYKGIPVIAAAFSDRHPRRLREHPHQKRGRFHHKTVQFDSIVACRLDPPQRLCRLLFIFRYCSKHDLLYCFFHPSALLTSYSLVLWNFLQCVV